MNIVIWGVNSSKPSMTEYLVQRYFDDVLFVVDNNKSLWDNDFLGKKIVSPLKIQDYDPKNTKIIIATYFYIDEIIEQARLLGYQAISFVRDMKEEYSQYRLSIFAKDTDGRYIPKVLHINFTEECNLQCVWCYFHGIAGRPVNKSNGGFRDITDETLAKIMNSVRNIHSIDMLCYATAGELFMNKRWFEQVSYVLREMPSIKKFKLTTNGMLLTEENIRKLMRLRVSKFEITISIDGNSPEETEKYRINSSYERIKQNVHRLISLTENSDKFDIGIECYQPYKVGMNPNQSVFPQYLRDDFPNQRHGSGYVVTPNLSNKNFEEYGLKSACIKRDVGKLLCHMPFEGIYFDCLGNMRMCACGQFSGQLVIGQCDEDALDVWQNSEIMRTVRQKLGNFESCEYCGHCFWQNFDTINYLCEV